MSSDLESMVVPYQVVKEIVLKHERENRRMIIALIASISVAFLTNLAWLYAWTRYDYESSSETRVYSQDGQGINMIGSNMYGDSEPAGTDTDNNRR